MHLLVSLDRRYEGRRQCERAQGRKREEKGRGLCQWIPTFALSVFACICACTKQGKLVCTQMMAEYSAKIRTDTEAPAAAKSETSAMGALFGKVGIYYILSQVGTHYKHTCCWPCLLAKGIFMSRLEEVIHFSTGIWSSTNMYACIYACMYIDTHTHTHTHTHNICTA